ncbi:hypothetical protein ACFLT7_06010 [candidate division KSB1 bacterium]
MADLTITMEVENRFPAESRKIEADVRRITKLVETESKKMVEAADRVALMDRILGRPAGDALDPIKEYRQQLQLLRSEYEKLSDDRPLEETEGERRSIEAAYYSTQAELRGLVFPKSYSRVPTIDPRILAALQPSTRFTPENVLGPRQRPGQMLTDLPERPGYEYTHLQFLKELRRGEKYDITSQEERDKIEAEALKTFKAVNKIAYGTLVPAFGVLWKDVFDMGQSKSAEFAEKMAAHLASLAVTGLTGGLVGWLMPGNKIGFWKGFKTVLGFQHGGFVGGTGGPDSQLRFLSPREYVVNERAAVSYAPLLESINRGEGPGSVVAGGDTFIFNVSAIDVRDFQQKLAAELPPVLGQLRRHRSI